MKFGGTSVATIDHIVKASEKVIEVSKQSKVIVVLSAMAGVTNSLVDQVKKISDNDDPDSDLMSIYLNKKGINSRTWTGWQIPIITNSIFGKARIEKISCKNIIDSFNKYDVAVVTGFQGLTKDNRISTLGRGGSDTTAIAIAAAFNAPGPVGSVTNDPTGFIIE